MSSLLPRAGRVGSSDYTAYDQGAQLATWEVDGVPVIWTSAWSRREVGQSIRGGVPICWPWFATGPDGGRTPQHGFVRKAPWRLLEHSTDDPTHVLRWELTQDDVVHEAGAEQFAHPFRAVCSTLVGTSVEVRLDVTNTGLEPISYDVALHTYLHVGDVRQVRVTGLEDAPYWDKVLRSSGRQEGPLRLTGETDRIYTSSEQVRVHDPVLRRTLTVSKGNSTHTVVWNPWDEVAADLADLGDDEWPQMVCVEAAAIGTDAVQVDPGDTHSLSTRISVSGEEEDDHGDHA